MGGIQKWTDWGICPTKGFIISDVQPSVLIPGSWSFSSAESVSHDENLSWKWIHSCLVLSFRGISSQRHGV